MPQASCRAASITTSNPRKRSSSSCFTAITRIWTASPSVPRGSSMILSSRSAFDRIVDLSAAIAQCAVTHGAALQMTFYEGHGPNRELTALAQQRPTAILRGDGADVAGRPVERLPQARCRPSRPGRPHRPGDAAGRSRRHPLQRQRRQARRAAVPDPVGGTGQPCRPPMRSLTARRRSSRPMTW